MYYKISISNGNYGYDMSVFNYPMLLMLKCEYTK